MLTATTIPTLFVGIVRLDMPPTVTIYVPSHEPTRKRFVVRTTCLSKGISQELRTIVASLRLTCTTPIVTEPEIPILG